jgi:hypothetical protein
VSTAYEVSLTATYSERQPPLTKKVGMLTVFSSEIFQLSGYSFAYQLVMW